MNFITSGWNSSIENEFAESVERDLEEKINEAKKVIVERNKNKLKFIIYTENKDGGI